MVLSIVFILLVALVAFFHFTQGFFSATLSAIVTVIAAMIAVGWHEDVIAMLKPGKFADSASAMVLCMLFAVVYIVCRVLLDKLVPGNVRFPSTVDKVGGALMGVVAGIMATGVCAIAIQSMGLGPSIGGYARYQINPLREVHVNQGANGKALDRKVFDEMKNPRFEPADVSPMLFPVDSIVAGLVATTSSGALSGRQDFTNIHPDFLQELFGQRLGIEMGARHTAANWTPAQDVAVKGIFTIDRNAYKYWDAEAPDVRGLKVSEDKKTAENNPPLQAIVKADPMNVWLVVRVEIEDDARDVDDGLVRFSPGSVRMVIKDAGKFQNFYPIGTVDYQQPVIWINHMDDPMVLSVPTDDRAIDFVFSVPPGVLLTDSADKKAAGGQHLPPGSFLEFKRNAKVDLTDEAEGGGPIKPYNAINAPHPTGPSIMRKLQLDPRLVKPGQ